MGMVKNDLHSVLIKITTSYMSARSYKGRMLGELLWMVVSRDGSEIRGRLIQSED